MGEGDRKRGRLSRLLKRALLLSAIVGSLLILNNHGDHLLEEPKCDGFALKCVLSYAVPFFVSLVSAVIAARDNQTVTTSSV